MEKIKVLIVGWWPAGLSVARAFWKWAIVIHRDKEIWLPVRTSWGSWKNHLDKLWIPENLYQKIEKLCFASSSKKIFFEFKENYPVVLDITQTYKYIANEAIKNGAEIKCSHSFIGIDKLSKDGVICSISFWWEIYKIESEYVIDASWYQKVVLWKTLWEKNQRVWIGVEYEFKDLSNEWNTASLFVGSKFAPSGYWWIFPTNQKTRRIWIWIIYPDSKSTPKVLLEDFLKSKEANEFSLNIWEKISIQSGVIPAWGVSKSFWKWRIIGVWDSVWQAIPTVGEWIRYSIEAWEILGKLLIKNRYSPKKVLFLYYLWWKTKYWLSFFIAQYINKKISNYDDIKWNKAIKRLSLLKAWEVGCLLRAEINILIFIKILIRYILNSEK
jgi:digeranylgeranylglycerophospholipid reductase